MPADGLLLAWIGTVLAFYSLAAGKRSVYLLPLFPPLAVLLGSALADLFRQPAGAWARAFLWTGAALVTGVGLLVALGAGAALFRPFAFLMEGSDRARLPAVLDCVQAHRGAIGLGLGACAAALVVLATATLEPARLAALAIAALVWVVAFAILGTWPLAAAITERPAVERLREMLHPGDAVCARGDVGWAFRFYLGRPVPACGRVPPGATTFAIAPERHPGVEGPHYHATRLVDGRPVDERCLGGPQGMLAGTAPARESR